MLLSICIPTIFGRESQYQRIRSELDRQINNNKDIEIITIKDNKEMPIGIKRQRLLELCKGEYCVQIDDDDYIAPYYIEEILNALKETPDCVGYIEEILNGQNKKYAIHSNRFDGWGNKFGSYHYFRTIFCKDVIKTEIAKQIGFSNMQWQEDKDFADRLKASGLLNKEVFIDKIMYIYEFPTRKQLRERYGHINHHP